MHHAFTDCFLTTESELAKTVEACKQLVDVASVVAQTSHQN